MLPAPTNQRETFNLLTRLVRQPLEELLELIDWESVSPTQLYEAVLGRLPELVEFAVPPHDYSARTHFLEMLLCEEFQSGVVLSYLRQFPESRRLIFVHVPKCAGTDLIYNLSRYHPHLSSDHANREWIPPDDLLAHLAKISVERIGSPDLLVTGHFSLRHALDNYYRFGDSLFTIIREPRSLMLSHVNYVINLLQRDQPVTRPDTRQWWTQLNRPVLAWGSEARKWQALAIDVLHHPEMTMANYLCTYIGDGTARGALDTMTFAPIDIVDIGQYDRWLKERWGIASDSRANAGTATIGWDTLSARDRAHVDMLTREDEIFYQLAVRVRSRKGTLSVSGRDLWDAQQG
jgi:hypothetical protein